MKLKDALKKDKFIVTSEVQSPVDDDPEELIFDYFWKNLSSSIYRARLIN